MFYISRGLLGLSSGKSKQSELNVFKKKRLKERFLCPFQLYLSRKKERAQNFCLLFKLLFPFRFAFCPATLWPGCLVQNQSCTNSSMLPAVLIAERPRELANASLGRKVEFLGRSFSSIKLPYVRGDVTVQSKERPAMQKLDSFLRELLCTSLGSFFWIV